MRVVIVDDEEPARRRLKRLLTAFPDTDVVGEAGNGGEALQLLEQFQVDLLLLDIQMPGLDGLALAQRYTDLPPIIFVTAHSEHAVQAFEVNAVDYLLKPVRPERLAAAMARVDQQKVQSERAKVSKAFEVIAPAASSTRIVTGANGTYRFFEAAEIHRFWSSEKYTLFVADGEEHLTEEPLSSLEARLQPLGFQRIHRAELVRVSSIKALKVSDGEQCVELQDGQVARVSRRSMGAVREALGL